MEYRVWTEHWADVDHAPIVLELNPRHDQVYVGMLPTNQLDVSTVHVMSMDRYRIRIMLWPGLNQSGTYVLELYPFEGHTCFVRFP